MNKIIKNQRDNLVGKIFGKLTVIEYVYSLSKAEHAFDHYYRCSCACGEERTVIAGNLKSGNTKSCGCGRKSTFPKEVIEQYQNGVSMNALCRQYNSSINAMMRFFKERGVRIGWDRRRQT